MHVHVHIYPCTHTNYLHAHVAQTFTFLISSSVVTRHIHVCVCRTHLYTSVCSNICACVHVYRGWEQLEVTCNPRQLDKNNVWNVEGNENDQCETDIFPQLVSLLINYLTLSSATVPNVSFDFYKPSYLSKFLESHVVMAEVGATCNYMRLLCYVPCIA